jgi:hypothetical protein
MTVTDDAFDKANQRGAAKQAAYPAVVSVRYDKRVSRIIIALASGLELAFSPKHAQGLENAGPAELADAEITPSGLGVHFPHLDADLYLPALLEGFLGSKRWMSEIGKLGGARSTVAKAAASRQNGKLGGRPRKTA